jgi:aminoglycoside 2''-phosphotransferase
MPTDPNAGKLDSYLTQLRRDMPELSDAKGMLVESGQYNDVVIVDDRLVARFPKRAAHIADARRAARLLECIHARLPLPVPRPTLTRLTERPVGSAYVAYAAIPGVPFHGDVWESLGAQARTRVVGQLAAFLRALHGVGLPAIEELGTPRAAAAEWDRMGADVREQLFPHMRRSARMEVEELFAALAHAEFTPALIHGDFGTASLL